MPVRTEVTAELPEGGSADAAQAIRVEQHAIASALTKDFPQDFDAWRVMGFVHSSHGRQEEMFRCWVRCSQLQPNRADVYEQMGRYALQTEKYEDAIGYFQRALSLNPQLVESRENIGMAFMNVGRTKEAVEALEGVLEVAPQSSRAHYLLGEAYFQLQNLEAAKASYERALQITPAHRQACYGLVKTCTRLKQRDEALKYAQMFQRLEAAAIQADLIARREYDDLRDMRQRLVVTCLDAGRVYDKHGSLDQARSVWQRAAAMDDQNIESRSLLASLSRRQGKAAEALGWYQQLVKLQPKNVDHYQQIGFLHARLGDLTAAESALKKMVALAPENAAGYRSLAKLYLNTNRQVDQAYRLAAKALKLEPVADSYFILGWAQAKNGKLDDARDSLQKAMALDPNNAPYRQLYEAVSRRK